MTAAIDLRTQTEITNSLAQAFPRGRLFCAANINESNLRRLLLGLAVEFGRIENKIGQDVYDAYFINEDKDGLLEEWESLLGIPDGCFLIEGLTRDERIINIQAKLREEEVSTEQDFIDFAAILGIPISIEQGINNGSFPLILPFVLGTLKTLRFTMIINLPVSLAPVSIFPLTLPFTLSSGGSSVIECLFNRLRPANVKIIYNYSI